MKLCNEHCVPCCDFCKFLKRLGKYDGIGICLKDNTETMLYWSCNDFECSLIEDKEV